MWVPFSQGDSTNSSQGLKELRLVHFPNRGLWLRKNYFIAWGEMYCRFLKVFLMFLSLLQKPYNSETRKQGEIPSISMSGGIWYTEIQNSKVSGKKSILYLKFDSLNVSMLVWAISPQKIHFRYKDFCRSWRNKEMKGDKSLHAMAAEFIYW